jgi:hypothetical protein
MAGNRAGDVSDKMITPEAAVAGLHRQMAEPGAKQKFAWRSLEFRLQAVHALVRAA